MLHEVRHSLAEALIIEGKHVVAVAIERETLRSELLEGNPRAREKLVRLGRGAEAPTTAGREHDELLIEAARCYAAADDKKRAQTVLEELGKRNPGLVVDALDRDPDLRRLLLEPRRP
jgi:hypothetical protein